MLFKKIDKASERTVTESISSEYSVFSQFQPSYLPEAIKREIIEFVKSIVIDIIKSFILFELNTTNIIPSIIIIITTKTNNSSSDPSSTNFLPSKNAAIYIFQPQIKISDIEYFYLNIFLL
jgi:hypothetical protein